MVIIVPIDYYTGLTVYHSKQYGTKQWVVYDLEFGE